MVITSGGERERERLASLGVSLFLRRPVSYQDVAGAIRTLLGVRLASDRGGAPVVRAEPQVGAASGRG